MNGRFAVLLSTFSLILATVCTVFAQGFSTGELEVRVLDLDGQAMEGIDVTLIGVGKKTTPDAVWTALGEGAYQLTATAPPGFRSIPPIPSWDRSPSSSSPIRR